MAEALPRWSRRMSAQRACAWIDEVDSGSPVLLSAVSNDPDWKPAVLGGDAFAELTALERPTDLGSAQLTDWIHRWAREQGLSILISLGRGSSHEGKPHHLVLAFGSRADPPGRVRTATLGLLGEAAEELRKPASTLTSAQRLAGLGEEVLWLNRRAALGELVSELVHEVRNPLVSVRTFLQMLPERLADPEFMTDFRNLVMGEVERLERLLDSVLRHAGDNPGDTLTEPARVDEALDAMVTLLHQRANQRNVKLERTSDPPLSRVQMREDVLRQVLLNLTLNALEAAPAGGHVRLDACETEAGEAGWIEIAVEDDGPGIPIGERERLFEPFQSSKKAGPGGLGLAISRRLVEEAGGSIRVDEGRGGGARLIFSLPRAAAGDRA